MKQQLNEVQKLQKIAGIVKEVRKKKDVYDAAGSLITLADPGTLKNLQNLKAEDPYLYKELTKKFTDEEIAKATEEYKQWLDIIIPKLETIYNGNLYRMHLRSLEGGSPSFDENYDYLGDFIESLKDMKDIVEQN